MMKYKALIVWTSYVFFSAGTQSCNHQPYACFTTSVPEDSIYIGQPVTFSALCSDNASEYFWKFYDNSDSVEFTANVTKTFSDTGQVKVTLFVANGKKTSGETKYIQVKP